MRVLEYHGNEGVWNEFRYGTTYPMEWINVVFQARAIYTSLNNPQVLVAKASIEDFKMVEIGDTDSFIQLEEGIALEIRGECSVYNGVPIALRFYSRTENVQLFIPSEFIEKLAIVEQLDDDGKKHRFDRLMDSVEYISACEIGKYVKTQEIMDMIPKIIM